MVLGLHTYSHHLAFGTHPGFRPSRPMDIFAFMDRAVEYGLKGIAIHPAHLASTDEEYLASIREDAGEKDLFVQHTTVGVDPMQLDRSVHQCRLLGARVLVTSLGFARRGSAAEVRTKLLGAREDLRASVPLLEESGVTLAIESHGDATSEELVQLVEDIGSTRVGLCVDVGNSLCVMEDPLGSVRRMVPFAVTAHLKDVRVTVTPCGCSLYGTALGEGALPLEELYRVLNEEGEFDQMVLEIPVEPEHGEKHSLHYEEVSIRKSIAYCSSVLGVGGL